MSAEKVLRLLVGLPQCRGTLASLSEWLSSYFFSFGKGSGFLSDSEVQDGATYMHIPKQQELPF